MWLDFVMTLISKMEEEVKKSLIQKGCVISLYSRRMQKAVLHKTNMIHCICWI